MAELFKTNLVLVMSPLPADFEGTPQELGESIVERLEIQSPVGTNFFIVGSDEPTSNQGPWLKDGLEWYVFDETEGRYVPLQITESVNRLFTVSSTTPDAPTGDDATIWLRTTSGRVIGWYYWTGSEWRPGGNVPPSGTTANRPSNPLNYEQYFDTDINVLIHWERGAWRTVSGSPGDIKMVTTSTLADAKTNNPGWDYLGSLSQEYSGRVLGVATKDPGASPIASFGIDAGITPRATGDITGTETHLLAETEIPSHAHAIGQISGTNGPGLTNRGVFLFRDTDGKNLTAWPNPVPANWWAGYSDGSTSNSGKLQSGELALPEADGHALVTSRQLQSSVERYYTNSVAHNNMQPTKFVWALYKL